MALRGRTPEMGGKGLTFTFDKCHGKRREGWLSGDVHVLHCHVGNSRKSKPCERVLLGKKAACAGCDEKLTVEALGYVPLRDQTGRPTCVLIRKDRIPFVGNLERGSSVYYGKDEGRFESVYVIPRLVDQKWDRYFTKEPTDDMGFWLPTFLGVPHLAPAMRQWFLTGECQPVVTAAPVEPIPPVVAPAKLDDAVLGDRGLVEGHKPLEATLHRIRAREARSKSGSNGTH